jgi:hypothetical protein
MNTVFGKLRAEAGGNSEHCGIDIDLEYERDGRKHFRQLAVVESTRGAPKADSHSLRLMVWEYDKKAPSRDITLLKQHIGEDKDATWQKYLQYLREWAAAHSGSGFYGMTPACFEEWRNAELSD